ncbi:uncharacterized protein LOC131943866 [Physella acuta]|uniref:uncharacterized protein LOC131943866 n=1 Tax=Physella acuta TaxID=109671 RepID=UPI0027DD818C|nr:uncharacterized protein LOC131943866 [Physella acuta]
MMTLLLITLTLATVSGNPTWYFSSPPATRHDKEPDVRSYSLDYAGFNAIGNALRYESAGYKMKFRVAPPRDALYFSEDSLPANDKRVKSCLPKTGINQLKCNNYTDPASTCTVYVDLPCKAKPGHSRWEANLLMDVTIVKEKMLTVRDCTVMCLDIGYFDDDVYQGGNGISYGGTGWIVAFFVLGALVVLLGGVYVWWRWSGKQEFDYREFESMRPKPEKPSKPLQKEYSISKSTRMASF